MVSVSVPSPVLMLWLLVPRALSWAAVIVVPPTTMLAMPSVAETMKVPLVVSLSPATRPCSETVASGPSATKVVTITDSTVTSCVAVAVTLLPAGSVAVTLAVTLASMVWSAIKSAVLTSML